MLFINLKLYTEYSIDRSIIKISELIKIAKSVNQKYLCITDANNIYNSLNFYKECIKNDIKPIVGCELNIKLKKKIYNFTILIKNLKGYNNICKLLSRMEITGYDFLKFEWLKGFLKNNLIFILNLNNLKLNKNLEIGHDLKIFKNHFKDILHLEINPFYKKNNSRPIINFSNKFKIQIIPFNPVYFTYKKDFRYCLHKAKIFKNFSFMKTIKKINYFYLKNKSIKITSNIKKYLKNTLGIFKKCNFIIKINRIKLPFYRINNKLNNRCYIIKILNKKLKKLKLGTIYKKRMFSELKIILNMNLVDYFLIVYDFIKWSKKKKIQVGPGRGSSAGSLISFLLDITTIDPLKNDLLFERFLNIERSIPDFDIDFCQEKRDVVIKYMKKKYGICHVSNIITFNKMNIKSSIKDIGKFLKINYDFINEISKILSSSSNINVLELLKKDKSFYKKYKKNKKLKKLVKFCYKLEGLIKNTGMHSGGVVVSPDKLYNHMPVKIQQNGVLVSHFCKQNIEDIGLLKFDFLGLITLTIIKNCINKNRFIKFIEQFNKINLKDNKCYEILKQGNTVCVFQLESFGIRQIIKKIKPDNFKNIIALISLYRPGPIKLINEFYMRKIGERKIKYINQKLKKILSETYGIIIYQEQIMKIVEAVGGYSLNDASRLMKIICSKNKVDMSVEKKNFLHKSLKMGYCEEEILKIYNFIKEFANYGFNKSHATAYAFLTYQTLWLKTYFKVDFIAANMSYYCRDSEKFNLIIQDSFYNKIIILNPDINYSKKNFKVIKNLKQNVIRYGLIGVVGLGFNIIKEIIKSRKLKGLYKNFVDFYKRVNKSIINYKSMENLICSGCFDSINQNRASLLKELHILNKKFNKLETSFYKKIYIKKNYYWSFKNKILEHKNSIGIFLISNINDTYFKRLKKIRVCKNKIYGTIINIFDNVYKNNIDIKIIDFKNFMYTVKINKKLLKKKKNIIKIYNFIIIDILKVIRIGEKSLIIPIDIFSIKDLKIFN